MDRALRQCLPAGSAQSGDRRRIGCSYRRAIERGSSPEVARQALGPALSRTEPRYQTPAVAREPGDAGHCRFAPRGAVLLVVGAPFVVRMIESPDRPIRLPLTLNWRTAAFGAFVAVAVTFLFRLVPALRASAVKPVSALKGGEACRQPFRPDA